MQSLCQWLGTNVVTRARSVSAAQSVSVLVCESPTGVSSRTASPSRTIRTPFDGTGP